MEIKTNLYKDITNNKLNPDNKYKNVSLDKMNFEKDNLAIIEPSNLKISSFENSHVMQGLLGQENSNNKSQKKINDIDNESQRALKINENNNVNDMITYDDYIKKNKLFNVTKLEEPASKIQ